jgi:putative spermidine/putrescine transport system permease protein
VQGLQRVDSSVAGDQGLTRVPGARPPSFARRVSGTLHRHPRLRLVTLLAAPTVWRVVAYLGALAVLLVSAFWTTDAFTGNVVKSWSTENFHRLVTTDLYRTVTIRTIGVAVAVTVICVLVATPMAFFMAKIASPRTQRWLVVAVLTPLWASYLVKAYAWRGMLAGDGVVNWLLGPLGLRGPGFGLAATVIVLAYLWLPFMILPIYAGLERLPDSLLEASGDLGASAWRTVRSVVLPLAYPAIVAGSIFTFSLSLGDYIAVQIVGGKNQLLGNLIQSNVGAANNVPLAAAIATIPVAVMVIYLLAVRRTGALDNL